MSLASLQRALGRSGRWHLGLRALTTPMDPAKREEKRKLRERWLAGERPSAPEEEEEHEVPSGKSPVFPPAAEVAPEASLRSIATIDKRRTGSRSKAAPKGLVKEAIVDWDDPGANVLEQAREKAEDWDGWSEDNYEDIAAASHKSTETFWVTKSWRQRRTEVEAPRAIKDFIELHRLGDRPLRKLKRGTRRQQVFAGADPAHSNEPDAMDDGKDSTLGRLAVALHRGFLRHRARCHPAGDPEQRGTFPLAERPEVAFIGPSNVGKSSLLNAITRTQKLAEARDEPGLTRSIDWFKCSRLPIDIIDLPGYGYAKGADFGGLLADFIATRKSLRTLYVLVDARTGLQDSDTKFFADLGDRGPEKVFILTKSDMVVPKYLAKSATLVLQDIKFVPRSSQRLIIVSSRLGQGMHDLRCHLCSRAIAMVKEQQKRSELKAKAKAARREIAAKPWA
eukprot:TRINITY_DN35394_c0_g1_i1.p1 TRINITY_DN35394_c0_g1~~TRINITY_DN35394_c0_g1_i1.p1  ORF type:complete len:505 (+),score=91.14 TRINITY_DN35394_c0_g1_i1:163-1515(+)